MAPASLPRPAPTESAPQTQNSLGRRATRDAVRPSGILGLVSGPEPPRWFVLDAVAIDDVDYTGGQTLSEVADQLAERKIVLAIAGASPQLRVELDRFGVTARIGADHYYDGIEAAREAFRASQQA